MKNHHVHQKSLLGIGAVWLLLSVSALGLAAPRTTAEVYQRSYKLEAAGKYAQALSALQAIVSVERGQYIYQLRLGWLNYLAGKHTPARAAYKRAAALAPGAVEPLLGLMLPQMAVRKWKDADRTARRILRMAPGNDLASTRHAWILYNLGRYDDAEQIYRSVLRSFPANLEMRAGLGWSLLAQGRKADARAAFAEVLRFSPQDSSATKGIKALK